MNDVFAISAPIFGIGLFGYAATRFGFFSAQAGEGLARFVFDFAIPVFLVRSFANADFPVNMPLDLIAAYYLPIRYCQVIGFRS